ncbi:DUF3488 and DUF4129 domain-containing transglutaminase family protein [Shewanella waksmanii]|uniref:transglutaminase TgpA family protein n=1 Tax=Shewanella waksmanii TaxID=213783 RepID=UPI003735BEB9
MKQQQELITRNSQLLLLIVNIAVLSPLYGEMTPWSLGICTICFLWQLGIYLGRVAKPPKYLVTVLALGSASTLILVSSQIGMLDTLINLLTLGYALKFIEMRQRRDVRTVVLAGYFLIAMTFVEKQSLWFALHLTFVTAINTAVLVSLYRSSESVKPATALGFKIILQSIPVAILLFIVLPRLPPIWMVPKINSATTGLSDEVSFGNIESLTRSAKLAFRATFTGSRPVNAELYWRAIVLENYDGKTWTQDSSIQSLQSAPILGSNFRQVPEGDYISYDIIAEPSKQHWLYGLDVAYSDNSQIINMPDYRLYNFQSVDQRFQYTVRSYANAIMDPLLPKPVRRSNLTLPEDSNPRTKQLALTFKADYPDPIERIDAMMTMFNQQQYFYTLTPPPVGPQQIDDFLLENKAGFCVHYASALTFMARTSGIPARMVTGYQGGEYNRSAGYVSVYQYMAHAWVEVWFEDKGWVRVDPTAMIAPERVEDGFDAFFNPQESYLLDSPFTPLRLRAFPLLDNLRMSLASIDYYWSKWVLGFDNTKQQQLLKDLLGNITPLKLALFILAVTAITGLIIAYNIGLINLKRSQDPISQRYLQTCKMLEKYGFARQTGEAPSHYLQRIATVMPGLAEPISQFNETYTALKYKPLSVNAHRRLSQRLKKQHRLLKVAIVKHKTISS